MGRTHSRRSKTIRARSAVLLNGLLADGGIAASDPFAALPPMIAPGVGRVKAALWEP
jgi:hypothetical protein